MIKNNLIKISVCIILIMTLVFVIGKSFATDSNNVDILNELTGLNNNNSSIPQANRTTANEPNTTQDNTSNALNANNNNVNNLNSNANSNANKPATTPYTGIEHTPTILFILLFTGSTIYAYKKIRDYDA